VSKETYIHTKYIRDLYTYKKTNKKTCKRGLRVCLSLIPETCMYRKRPVKETYMCKKRPVKETHVYKKRPVKDVYMYKQRPVKETYLLSLSDT